jgi:hypothetical protein
MSKKRNTYKEFFGIREEITVSKKDDPNWIDTVTDLKDKNPDEEIKITETDLEEAQLINNITDYQGGVQYMLRDAAMANNVAEEIKQFAIKKKIYPVKHTKSKSGKAGYFYFRLGDDPAKESQQLQGYLSQKPEIKYFRFKVIQQQQPRQNRNI